MIGAASACNLLKRAKCFGIPAHANALLLRNSVVVGRSFKTLGSAHKQVLNKRKKLDSLCRQSSSVSSPPKKNIFLDNLGSFFLGGIGFIIAWLVRSYMGTQARNKLRDTIEASSLLDPLELDDLRVANSELTASEFLEICEDLRQEQQEFTYEEFVVAARQAMIRRKEDWTIQLGHLLDRASMLAMERRGKSIATDRMPLIFWLTVFSMAISSTPDEKLHALHKILVNSTDGESISNELITELVSFLQDTCQIVPDAQVVATTAQYPIQRYAVAAPVELVERYRVQKNVDRPLIVRDEDDLRDLLTSHSICVWGECYKHKR